MKKPEYWVALTVIAGAILIILAMSVAIGKFSFGTTQRHLKVLFKSVDGISINSDVKYAGAPVGRVVGITVLSREEQRASAAAHIGGSNADKPLAVELTLSITPDLQLGNDIGVTLKQDGFLGARYIALIPGNLDSPDLDWSRTLVATQPKALDSLIEPAEQALAKANVMIDELMPTIKQLNGVVTTINESLPNLIISLDALLDDGDNLITNLNTPENQEKLRALLENLAVTTANLKVVASNAKALTLTLAETPWRLIWGGKTNPPPPEKEVLKSSKPIPVKNVIEVNAPKPN